MFFVAYFLYTGTHAFIKKASRAASTCRLTYFRAKAQESKQRKPPLLKLLIVQKSLFNRRQPRCRSEYIPSNFHLNYDPVFCP
ncbi:MAG: hypothetical protein ACJAWT_001643 [Glaciecola sp.]|jgi:hypothetical protein